MKRRAVAMPLHYCTECGSKLQPNFKFCPSCGEKLHSATEEPEPSAAERATEFRQIYSAEPVSLGEPAPVEHAAGSALTRTPIRPTKRRGSKVTRSPATPSKVSLETASPKVHEEEEQKKLSSFSPSTPPSAKGKGKRTKRICLVEPVQEGLQLCDQSGMKWKLMKLLCQMDTELTYGVVPAGLKATSVEWKHICKMGTKDGQLFNEQNFLQRAAKPAAVEKWIKKLNVDFLGIPSCVGFGVHETYRFLIFPNMGQTLESVMDSEMEFLPEKAVLQLVLRLLDALEFIHENEYAHADIHAGNIYISTNGHTQVFLSGFGHAFRFCPGGKHVEYREGSRMLHQGNLNFISVDSHKGAGPSRRSDLQSLGYCLLSWMTGTLPWDSLSQSTAVSAEKERYMTDVPGLMRYCFKRSRVSGAIQSYLSQTMSLHYTEKPDYSLLKAGINDELQKLGGTLREPLICR